MGARNLGGIGLSYRPARLHRLAELIPWNQFRGPINSLLFIIQKIVRSHNRILLSFLHDRTTQLARLSKLLLSYRKF